MREDIDILLYSVLNELSIRVRHEHYRYDPTKYIKLETFAFAVPIGYYVMRHYDVHK